ncbi:MAG TPA: hypothetical protein VI197_32655 [Polyangiaceae bacterium]
MRTLITGFTLFVPTALLLAGACADTDSSCEDTLSCSGDTTTVGGTAGTLTEVIVGAEGFAGDGSGTSNNGVLGIAQSELNLADL